MKKKLDDENDGNKSFIELVARNLYSMLMFRNNSSLISTISNEIRNSQNKKGHGFLKIYDDEIINYLEEKIKNEIELGNIKKCDAHLTAFILYIFYSIVKFYIIIC